MNDTASCEILSNRSVNDTASCEVLSNQSVNDTASCEVLSVKSIHIYNYNHVIWTNHSIHTKLFDWLHVLSLHQTTHPSIHPSICPFVQCQNVWIIFTGPMYKLLSRFTVISDVYRSFIRNKTTFTKYCLTQWISKLPWSFEIHQERQYQVNFVCVASIVNPTGVDNSIGPIARNHEKIMDMPC